ncbi:MAG TPA: PEP-CTERM sorting domain-containing protein [Phycisphaerae bacterium]|nr:PEP-CTERM sorting domain-containing protein [Phycisphaerae bacterium]HRW54860.1 PEP-CTERM sorting domain-containing protein [Phycisphaerae bacterium]
MQKGWLCAAVMGAMLAGSAHADDLIIIDLSVPDEVTLIATAGLSAIDASGPDSTGIYFENFYGGAGDSLSATFVSGDITNFENPSDGSPLLFRGGGGTDPGLNMWTWSSATTCTFTAGSQAFTGSATFSLDPNEYADMLAGSASGDIYFPADTFDDLGSAQILGTYQVVVPEPGALSLLGLGLGVTLLRRRR